MHAVVIHAVFGNGMILHFVGHPETAACVLRVAQESGNSSRDCPSITIMLNDWVCTHIPVLVLRNFDTVQ